MKFEYFFCAKQFFINDKRSLGCVINILSVVGIALGVMVLIIFTTISNGFESEFRDRILGTNPHILVVKAENSMINYAEMVDDLSKIDGVISVEPVLYDQVFLQSDSNIAGAVVKSFDFSNLEGLVGTYLNDQIECLGNLLNENKYDSQIILGHILAENLNVFQGDIVYLFSKMGNNRELLFLPFKVLRLIQTGIYQYDEALAFAHLTNVQSIFDLVGLASALEIKLNDPCKSNRIAEMVKNKLGISYLVRDWTEMNAELFLSLSVQNMVIVVLLSLIIIVASLGISSALFMMILEKFGDVAILKTMGLENFRIRRIFIFRGMTMSFLGGIFGVFLGCSVSYLINLYELIELPGEVYSLENLPVCIDVWNVSIVFFSTMLVCFLSILYPAYRASKLNPIVVLSQE